MTGKFSVSKDGLGFDRMVKLLFSEPVEKYPSFKNKSVCINFSLFASIFLLILNSCFSNLCFAQETYNLEIIFKTGCPSELMETFGVSLSSAGDVNNDSFDEIIIGSKSVVWSGQQDTSLGHAYIYFGGASIDTIVDIYLHGEHPLDLFGYSVAGLGDINCDGFDDIAVGAPNCSQIDSCGRVYIYYGGVGMDSVPDLVLKGAFCAAFGCGIASGDINGDGWNDVVVGEYWWDGGNGRVYVYYGGLLLDTIPDVIINGHNGEAFGKSVGSGGDLNSDGYEDIVVGADENSEAYPGAGKVYVFFGGDPMDTIPDCWLHGEGATHYLGWFNVNVIKNISLYDRALTGTKLWPNGFLMVNEGKIYMLDGGSPMDTLVDVWMVGRGDSSFLGNWTTSVNRINSDGYGEVLSGAIGDPPDPYGFGMGYLWIGADTMDTIPDAWLKGRYYGDQVGRRVASAGDVNGDGFDEVMFSNYAGINPTVWVCRYTGQGIEQTRSQSQEARFEVYPNPFREKIEIKYALSSKHCGEKGKELPTAYSLVPTIRIFDVAGREVMVYEMEDDNRRVAIDTKHLPCGIYFVQLKAGDGSVIKKVVKIE